MLFDAAVESEAATMEHKTKSSRNVCASNPTDREQIGVPDAGRIAEARAEDASGRVVSIGGNTLTALIVVRKHRR
jgi:hypothetical protein